MSLPNLRSLAALSLAIAFVSAIGCGGDSKPKDNDGACEGAACDICEPSCNANQRCDDGVCVYTTCVPTCGAGFRCVDLACVPDVCTPACADGLQCVAGHCVGPCSDGVDNDGDGWRDAADPDCAAGHAESGFSISRCNDGVDNDGDGLVDTRDNKCADALADEALAHGACADECQVGATRSNGHEVCALYDLDTMSWPALSDGPDHMHNRARVYTDWLRRWMLPQGGVFSANFTNAQRTQIAGYSNTRDSAIWTGTYLAAESLRAMATGSTDALEQVHKTVRTLHDFFEVTATPGYLARYAAPADSPHEVQAIFTQHADEVKRDVTYGGRKWHWMGNTSRDQYQGPMLGLSLAYRATADATIRELIRTDIVEVVEELMKERRETVNMVINGYSMPVEVTLRYAIRVPSETDDGKVTITLDAASLGDANLAGMREFMPRFDDLVRQLPGFSWVPEIKRDGSAIMLASFFLAALDVTKDVPAYATRRQAIQAFYEAHIEEWYEVMASWDFLPQCGAGYHGPHIVFQPAYNVARLEYDGARRERFRADILQELMWMDEVHEHKNVFYAWVHAANAPAGVDVQSIVSFHAEQLAQFPRAPRTPVDVDLTATYAEDPVCDGLAAEAVDVGERPVSEMMWQDNPWKRTGSAQPTRVYPGVDYLIAYWMGRYHGFLHDDSPNQCLRWKTVQ